MLTDKINGKLVIDIRPESTFRKYFNLTVDVHNRAGITGICPDIVRCTFCLLPKAGLLKSEVLWRILILSKLPFTGNTCGISGICEQISESGFTAVQLLLTPLVGAISAGCTAVLKPSPYVPNVSKVIEDMIADTFPEDYIAVTQGHRDVNAALLEERWDIIFFTGSPSLGRRVMTAAAKYLTPVVLELGGKSPCIIDKDADINVAAKRVAWGKTLNAGQTCIAPDYLMVHEDVKSRLLGALGKAFTELLGSNPQESGHFVRVVNDAAFERLTGYFKDGNIVFGGHTDKAERYIEPTVLDNVSPDSPVMQEEIFGPIFPVLTFRNISEVTEFVTSREKPLALYYFGKNGDYVLRHTSSGGSCLNDTILHIANEHVPFGGVGMSGMGSYHGKLSFDAFTHYRSNIVTPTSIDLPFRYMPYKFFKMVKSLL